MEKGESRASATLDLGDRHHNPIRRRGYLGHAVAEAAVISAGRRIVHTETRTTDHNNRLIATATASFGIIAPRS